jgi:hypothetical protein
VVTFAVRTWPRSGTSISTMVCGMARGSSRKAG